MYRDTGKLSLFKKYGKFMDPKMGTYFTVPGLDLIGLKSPIFLGKFVNKESWDNLSKTKLFCF